MEIKELKIILNEFGNNVRFEHDLKKKNWFNIGGKSKVFYKADDLKELVSFLKKLKNKEKIFVLGAGSNTLIKDGLFDGVVIKLGKNFNNISLMGENIIIAGSAVMDKSLSNFAMSNSLSGFEFLSCIPGTIGGGIRMNAGAYGSEFKDIIIRVHGFDRFGNRISATPADLGMAYRHSDAPEAWIFTSAELQGVTDDRSSIKKKMRDIIGSRSQAQPRGVRTGGSTFANPTGSKAWQEIDKVGCRGLRVGGAQVSEKHCNFLINTGDATAEDIETLGETVRQRVLADGGPSLRWEIRRVGRNHDEGPRND